MTLSDRLEHDFKSALKEKAEDKVSCLRMIKAAAINYAIEKKKDKLDDTEMVDLIHKELKKCRESFESYSSAGRKDLSDKTEKEMHILQQYLPKPLTEDEILALAKKAIANSKASAKSDAGRVMKELMPFVRGRADGKTVNAVVLKLLS